MEATFQKIVLTIAIVLLIGLLIIINISLTNARASMIWPPIITDCPDYWEDYSGNGSQCVNIKNIGKCSIKEPKFYANGVLMPRRSIDFSEVKYTGLTGLCEKQKWAKACGVAWDGITYGYGSNNPCDTKLPV
jgi:hypothetical protein